MNKCFYFIGILTLISLSCCTIRKRLESYERREVILSQRNDSLLFNFFCEGITNQTEFISLDNDKKTRYEIKPIIGSFFSDHRIFIDRKKYTLNLSKSTPIIFYRENIYYPKKHHIPSEKLDSLTVIEVIIR